MQPVVMLAALASPHYFLIFLLLCALGMVVGAIGDSMTKKKSGESKKKKPRERKKDAVEANVEGLELPEEVHEPSVEEEEHEEPVEQLEGIQEIAEPQTPAEGLEEGLEHLDFTADEPKDKDAQS